MIVIRIGLVMGLLALAGCGQRGDLYLPDQQTTKVEASPQPDSKEESKKK